MGGRLGSKVAETGSLTSVDRDPKNKTLIKEIVESGWRPHGDEMPKDVWLASSLYNYSEFKQIFFQHEEFTGYGETLLWSLGIKNRRQFEQFIQEYFPEQKGTHLLIEDRWKPLSLRGRDNRVNAIRTLLDNNHQLIADRILQAVMGNPALLGGVHEQESYELEDVIADPIRLQLVQRAFINLQPREQRILVARYVEDKTYEEIGEELGVSMERISEIEERTMKRLRRKMVNDQKLKKRGREEMKGHYSSKGLQW